MFPVPHSLQIQNGTNHIININQLIYEFQMDFGKVREAMTKSHFVIRLPLYVHRPRKINNGKENGYIVCLLGNGCD